MMKEDKLLCNEFNYDRDREYWNHFYLENSEKISNPSDFAGFISGYLKPGKHLLDLGCGNGRDSLYFLDLGLRVTGIDASNYIIERLNGKLFDNKNAEFICEDFTKHLPINNGKYDYVYSRFTLHAINERQEIKLLSNVRKFLSDDGFFFIEARTVKDSLYGKGIRVNKNAYIYDEHYRRFIDADEFRVKLEKLNFEIVVFEERQGFSKTESTDPVLLRCIARLKRVV